ncbi:tRNA uracil 4-sulfurtransferase ThiI [Streptomyces benahoarensis]|uniref:Probable tRNA sulfurtransferase n=1 Tax=Streptomyces benahoarensis TaxID=2595054 RepID=A0A553ZMN7_9ACTN|nr:tRNA uracil 4-sulfurtransferase ThiI [Streptomyces benahoarensis]TSB31752.1 tRNA 4-thiouridine(8) synthase ThiI [Streptomyces benahoarensis]TSB42717.1 tRNA 4-thiouridine(8) synthase ThiI [Streptomyces benahoarensis]
MTGNPRVPAPRDTSTASAGGPCVLLKHGEVFLKGRNRHRFIERLHDNLRIALRGIGGFTWIKGAQNITVVGGEVPLEALVERARRVVGFHCVEPAVRTPSTMEDVTATAVEALRVVCAERQVRSFAVRVRRRDKRFPLTSSEMAVHLGARIQEAVVGLPVDLTTPGVTLSVEIDHRETYLSWERHRGLSGLPVGSSGRALVLLSGGYDSPVAAHRAMRRGLACDFVHFSGAPYTNAASVYKAYALARELNRSQPPGALHVVALGPAQKQLAVAGAGRLQVVAQRRLMVRTASALAARTGAEALVTGDSLGQVASQTLANMVAVDEAARLPVLRPLVGWEKQEIIDEARAIGTAEVSVLPDEDCCSLLAPPQVSTRARLPQLRSVERRLEMDEVIEALLASAQVLRPGEDGAAPAPGEGCPAPA